jgi:hypothetical protein
MEERCAFKIRVYNVSAQDSKSGTGQDHSSSYRSSDSNDNDNPVIYLFINLLIQQAKSQF